MNKAIPIQEEDVNNSLEMDYSGLLQTHNWWVYGV